MIRSDFPYIPVPRLFYPFEEEAPFDKCSRCHAELLESNREYMIEKALKPGDTIYEYTICFDCIEKSRGGISSDSMQYMERFFLERVRPVEHRAKMIRKFDLDYRFWLDHCVVNGTPVDQMHEYQIMAHCQGPYMVFSVFPYCLGEHAADELVSNLSVATLKELDEFGDELIDIPPELRELWKRKPVLI
ncbi:MAG: hypothetical protein J4F31_00405 [Flavobacteriales bacterium]|nr:hypothetical protein [Flavobacteriales bacterium]